MTAEQPTPEPDFPQGHSSNMADYISVAVAKPDIEKGETAPYPHATIAHDANAEWVGMGVGEILKTAIDRGLDPIAIQQAMQGRMMR